MYEEILQKLKTKGRRGRKANKGIGKFTGTPECCNSTQEYLSWVQVARHVPPIKFGFCEDCAGEYQKLMKAQYRCAYAEEIKFLSNGKIVLVEGEKPDEKNNNVCENLGVDN